MMIVDVAVALGPNGDVDERMTRQLIEHMIEKADAGRDVGDARSIEVEADFDARFLGLACDCALAHGDFFASSRFGRGDSKPRVAWPPRLRRRPKAAGFRREARFD